MIILIFIDGERLINARFPAELLFSSKKTSQSGLRRYEPVQMFISCPFSAI
jgi:hypothetical protein